MFKKHLNNERGLTLVELLAVIVILGIIAAIAIPGVGNIIQNSKVDGAKADAIAMLNAAKLYELDGNEVSGNLSISDLEDYLETAGTDWTNAPTISKNGTKFVISGTAETGTTDLTFTNASIEDINNHDIDDDGYSIGTKTSDDKDD